jgi:regulator of protease activity HflC (stomatin/prohibitin superfamily)
MIIAIAMIAIGKANFDGETYRIRGAGFGVGVLGLVILFMSCFNIVPANTVGIPVTFGNPGSPIKSGPHILAPWTDIEEFSTRVQVSDRLISEYEGDNKRRDCVQLKANDGSAECVDITIRYTIDPAKAADLYRRYGDFDRVNDVLIRKVTNDTGAVTFNQFSPEQTIAGGITESNAQEGQKVKDLRATFRGAMEDSLSPFGITLDSISVGNVDFENPDVQKRIDAKIAARQDAETAKITQQKLLTEAETAKKVAETKADQDRIAAKGEADANRILSEALTPQVLQQKYYEALGRAGIVVTDGSTPVILNPAPPTTVSGG